MTQEDRYSDLGPSSTESGRRHFLIVPNDDEDLPILPRGIWCEEDGTIVIRDETGTDLPYTLFAGQFLGMRPVRVLATGTTGTFYGLD